MGNIQGGADPETDPLEAAVVQEGDAVAWPKVVVMGIERDGTAKGHSAG